MTGSKSEQATLDVIGLKCPLPILKAARLLRGMAAGEILLVLADDPVSAKDMSEFCDEAGYALLATGEEEGVFRFRIQK